jgi:hypothetical protein
MAKICKSDVLLGDLDFQIQYNHPEMMGFSGIAIDKLCWFSCWSRTGTLLNDLFVLDPVTETWTNLSSIAAGTLPTSRQSHGFTSEGHMLYLFGGSNRNGN